MSDAEYDVIVIGGGPGGSTVSTLVAKAGHRVLLLEKEKFPRYQIGESLLPATVQGICAILGVKDEVLAAGFVPKRGGTFIWGKSPEPWVFQFETNKSIGKVGKASALQVERSRFDEILLKNAAKNGVEVREECSVYEIVKENERYVGVRYRNESGTNAVARARYIVDASGNASKFHRNIGERIYSKLFQNVAIYGYFVGGGRLAPPYEGNILSAAFEDGWFWYIPLSDKLTSVGVVLDRKKLKDMDDLESLYATSIERCPAIKRMLSNATRMTEEPYSQLRARKDYSHNSSKYWDNGLLLIGDAACFVDPVFSSGVHLATYSGLLAARSINSCLASLVDETESFSEFEIRYRKEFGNFYNFLLAFYDVEQEKESYFWSARKILNTEEKDNEAFIRLITGFGTEGLANSNNATDFFRVREGFGDAFKDHLINEGSPSPKMTGRSSNVDMSQFMKGFTKEIVELQLQAALYELNMRRTSAPKPASDGLTVSDDFLHWRMA
jgi:FAD-dependent halogenase